jgi:CheY-like chemotaxis protein
MKKRFDVLVIEDEQVILDAIERICGAEEFCVEMVLDANQALKKIEKKEYRLILCDLILPDMTGFQFIQKMQGNGIDIPVIMMTGYSTMENAVNSLNKGAIDFIPKPFTADELYSVIRRGLNYLELRQQDQHRGAESIVYVPCPPKYYRLGYVTWLSKDFRGSVLIGVTDLFIKTIKTINKIELMLPQQEILQGSYCASLITIENLAHSLMAPISGRIIECNTELENNHTLIEKDPYFKGWLYRIIPSDYDYEIKNLVSCSMEML